MVVVGAGLREPKCRMYKQKSRKQPVYITTDTLQRERERGGEHGAKEFYSRKISTVYSDRIIKHLYTHTPTFLPTLQINTINIPEQTVEESPFEGTLLLLESSAEALQITAFNFSSKFQVVASALLFRIRQILTTFFT